jgi:hypothetical protein
MTTDEERALLAIVVIILAGIGLVGLFALLGYLVAKGIK